MVGVVDAGFPILLADGRGSRMTSPVVCYAKDKTLLGGGVAACRGRWGVHQRMIPMRSASTRSRAWLRAFSKAV